MISLRQLATLCHVSQSTVSRALKGDRRISQEVIKRVTEEAKRQHYRPSRVVQGIFKGRINAVALIASDTSVEPISLLTRVIQQTLLRQGFSTFVYNTGNDPETEAACFHEAVAHRVAGVIIQPTNIEPDEEYYGELLTHKIPFLLIGTFGSHLDFSFVHNDDITMGKDAVAHLASLGHRVIAHIAGPRKTLKGSHRFKGYKDGLQQAGLRFDSALVKSLGWSAEHGLLSTRQLLAERPDVTAIFAATDILAVGALRAIREAGLRVPADISLIGTGNISCADILDPPLTTMDTNTDEQGRRTAELMLRLVGHPGGEPPPKGKTEIVVPTRLLVRGSTAPPRKSG